jgi:hypothetical protein
MHDADRPKSWSKGPLETQSAPRTRGASELRDRDSNRGQWIAQSLRQSQIWLQCSGAVAVACAGGMRAAFAASVIRGRTQSEVIRVAGGGVGNLPTHGIALTVGD